MFFHDARFRISDFKQIINVANYTLGKYCKKDFCKKINRVSFLTRFPKFNHKRLFPAATLFLFAFFEQPFSAVSSTTIFFFFFFFFSLSPLTLTEVPKPQKL